MKFLSLTTFALSMLLQSSPTTASLRKLHHGHTLDNRGPPANDQHQDTSFQKKHEEKPLHEVQKHRRTSGLDEEATNTMADSNLLVGLLDSDDCAYLVDRINDTTEQFLNDYDDEEIIEMFCSDIEAGRLLRKEAQMEKGLDPDAPFATCESTLDTLLVQQKETLFRIISDPDVCKAEVQRELDGFKEARRTLRGSSRQLPRYIIVNKNASVSEDFIRRAMIIVKPSSVKP